MIAELKRHYYTKDFTLGTLYLNGIAQCFTVEDTLRPFGEKIYGKTCIPAGVYDLKLRKVGGFYNRLRNTYPQGVPHLQDVPDFKYVLIHPGNSPADTEGCILPVTTLNSKKGCGKYSRVAFKKIYPELIKCEKIVITNY